MMITEAEMYWLTRWSYIQGGLFTLGGIVVGLVFVWMIVSAICHAVNHAQAASYAGSKELLPVTRKSLRASLICLALSWSILAAACFVPTTKEMCAIKIVPVIVNNAEVQELPKKALELANSWLDDMKPLERQEK